MAGMIKVRPDELWSTSSWMFRFVLRSIAVDVTDCASGASCTVTGPTYWSTVRLTSITTRQYSVSASVWQDVDIYQLEQTEPAPTGDGTTAGGSGSASSAATAA